MNATIAEFLLRQASDATELAQRAKVLAALTQLPPRRRNELAEAVNMVCRTIAAHGGRGKVRFSLVHRGGHHYIEVSICDQQEADSATGCESQQESEPHHACLDEMEAAVLQRVGELVDHFESSGWPVSGAVIRMAQTLSPAFSSPTDSEVADWGQMLKANNALDALEFALRRARSLEVALGHAHRQKELQSELRDQATEAENLTMLSLVISKTKNAISIMQPDRSVIAVNDAFIQMTGYTPSEVVGQRLDELLFGPSTDGAAVRNYHQAFEDGHELTQDIMQYRKDGVTYWVESNLIPVQDSAGKVTRWIAIDNDITRRRQTEEALRSAKETAETNSRLKSEFLANLSHEIRTPMNAIIGMTELTLETDLSAVQREYLQTVRGSSEALLNLLNNILDLSKIEAGKMEIESIDFSVAEVVQDALKTLAVKASEKGLTLSANVPEDLPDCVRGDPLKLRQILVNLVGNAIKFTAAGDVAVDVQQQWHADGDIGLHFMVRDTGIGIPPDKLDDVFQAFTQADASTTRKFGGSGLGLTITSELVRLLGGRIWVQSDVGKGSTFHFTLRMKVSARQPSSTATLPAVVPAALPATTHPPSASTADDHGPKRRVRPLRVLVADDHDANRHLVTTVLGNRGHDCVEAQDGHAVLDALRQANFDVVLMDVQMPNLDGFQTTAAIRKIEQRTGGHLPIIALTAHAMTGDREKCLAAGMDAYLAKPLRPKELLTLVESVADLKPRTTPTVTGQTSDSSGAQEFDFNVALESLDNDVELLADQMRFFLNDGPALVQQIEEAIERNDPRQVQLAGHRLKGMLARYAYDDAVSLALELEQQGASGTLEGAKPLWQQLAPMVHRLADAIGAYIAP